MNQQLKKSFGGKLDLKKSKHKAISKFLSGNNFQSFGFENATEFMVEALYQFITEKEYGKRNDPPKASLSAVDYSSPSPSAPISSAPDIFPAAEPSSFKTKEVPIEIPEIKLEGIADMIEPSESGGISLDPNAGKNAVQSMMSGIW